MNSLTLKIHNNAKYNFESGRHTNPQLFLSYHHKENVFSPRSLKESERWQLIGCLLLNRFQTTVEHRYCKQMYHSLPLYYSTSSEQQPNNYVMLNYHSNEYHYLTGSIMHSCSHALWIYIRLIRRITLVAVSLVCVECSEDVEQALFNRLPKLGWAI